jgi:DMSO reductase anchor subunit
MCLPRLGEGLLPACAGACPTHAITVEPVNIEAWRADHAAADMPNLPSSDLTISTTRIELPDDVPAETVAASDWSLHPEHPHWPLVWLTVLTQVAAGVSVTVSGATDRAAAAGLAVAALVGSLAHLGRPGLAWKALRNLRRSWLSREVALFGLYAPIAMAAVAVPLLAPLAALVGLAGVYASARLYIVPGRPAWDTPLTIAAFAATGLAVGPLITGHEVLGAVGTLAALAVLLANVVRLWGDPEVSRGGTPELYRHRLRGWTSLRVALALAGVAALFVAPAGVAIGLVLVGEVVGRWLFYVTVVPANMPGSFWRQSAGGHR